MKKRHRRRKSLYNEMMRKAVLKATCIPTPWGPIMMDHAILLIGNKAYRLDEVPPDHVLKKGDIIVI